MALNFPASPGAGDTYSGYEYKGGSRWARGVAGTALPKNYIVNPAFQLSQEAGYAMSSAATSGDVWFGDMWRAAWTTTSSWQAQVDTALLGGSGVKRTGRLTCTATNVTINASNYCMFMHHFEGQRMADLQWGTGKGIPIVIRFFIWNTVTGGTMTLAVRNAAGGTTYLAPITLSAGWAFNQIAIPAPPVGSTWPNTSALWGHISIVQFAGTTYQGVSGWQSGNLLVLAGNTNYSQFGGTTYISDVGLYADPYSTGVAPPFVYPDYAEEERRCMRYWYKLTMSRASINGATTMGRARTPHLVPMRVAPTYTIVGTPQITDSGSNATITSVSSASNIFSYEADTTASAAAWTAGRAGAQFFAADTSYIAVNAKP